MPEDRVVALRHRCNLGLDCLREQIERTLAQHRGQRIVEFSWLT